MPHTPPALRIHLSCHFPAAGHLPHPYHFLLHPHCTKGRFDQQRPSGDLARGHKSGLLLVHLGLSFSAQVRLRVSTWPGGGFCLRAPCGHSTTTTLTVQGHPGNAPPDALGQEHPPKYRIDRHRCAHPSCDPTRTPKSPRRSLLGPWEALEGFRTFPEGNPLLFS